MRLIALLLVALTSLASHAGPPRNAKLQEELNATAGEKAEDCGEVATADAAREASFCAAEAFKKRRPFYVVYYLQGIDSVVGRAVGENEQGDLFELAFDLDPSGGAHWPESIDERMCTGDVRLVLSRTMRLRCETGKYRADYGFCPAVPRETPATAFAKETGTIHADLLVHQDGTASVLEMKEHTVSETVAQSALREVSQWRFYPASEDGHLVGVRLPVQLRSDGKHEHVSFSSTKASNCLQAEMPITRR